MLRRSLQMSLLTVLLLIAPAAALAQQAGTLAVENKTGATIRIGCDHYIDAFGQQVNLKSYWTLPPGFNGKLSAPGGGDIVAQKFVFFEITTDGESGGWFFDKANQQGYLYGTLTADGLALHKRRAANATSGYPPLTSREIDILNLKVAIHQGEQRLINLTGN